MSTAIATAATNSHSTSNSTTAITTATEQAFIPFIPTTPFQTIPTIISLPIANAGISQTVTSGASVTLNGAG